MMDLLPDALLSDSMAPFVPWRDRFYSLAHVSQRWRSLCWRSIHGNFLLDLTWCTGDHELDSVVHALALQKQVGDSVTSKLEAFHLYGPRVNAGVVKSLVAAMDGERVRRIQIESKQADDKAITALGLCVELTHLTLNCVKLTSTAVATLTRACSQLRAVSLAGCSRIDDDAVMAIANNCPMLIELDLFMCHRVSDRSMVALVIRKQKTLRRITVDRCLQISGLALRFLMRSHPSLTSVSFANCPRVRDRDFAMLFPDDTTKLQRIDMSGCAALSDEGAGAIISKHTASLEELQLRGLQALTSAAFITIPRCSRLQVLNLSLCRGLRNIDLTRIVTGCTQLQRLLLQGCVGIDNEGAESIARHAKLLQQLSLEFCYNIDDEGVTAIVDSCDCLVDLNLKALNQLTVDAFDSIVRRKSSASSVERINIGAIADYETTLRYASIIKRRYPRARIEWV